MSTRIEVTELDCECCDDVITEPEPCCGYESWPAHYGFQLGNTPHGADPDENCNEAKCQALNIPIVLDYIANACIWTTAGKYILTPPAEACSDPTNSIGFELSCDSTNWVLLMSAPGGNVTYIHPIGTWNLFGSNVMTLDQVGNNECVWPATVTVTAV